MSAGESLEKTMHRAAELERDCDWMGSVRLYQTALNVVAAQDVSKAAEIHEHVGYGLFRAAMQSDSADEFEKRMQTSAKAYEKAAELFGKNEPIRGAYCRGAASYSSFWITKDPDRKKKLLDDCWRTMMGVLGDLDASEDLAGLRMACRTSVLCAADLGNCSNSWQERESVCSGIMSYGNSLVAKFSQSENTDLIVWAYIMASFFILSALIYMRSDEMSSDRLHLII